MGRLSPLEGVGPGEINIEPLLARVVASLGNPTGGSSGGTGGSGGSGHVPIREVILGTNPNLEGDGTALYLAGRLSKLGVRVSRLARGLPTGTNLEVLSKAVLADAIQGRQEMN
jgi:recombination protein RecR